MVGMNQERLMKIILAPVISEKGTNVADKYRQFVFKVLPDATKQEIKNAVELLFKVAVKSVNICNVKGKRKMFKQRPGQRKNWKKAYVALHEGHDINFAGAEK
jgi:large subunit ribosomal protein L23